MAVISIVICGVLVRDTMCGLLVNDIYVNDYGRVYMWSMTLCVYCHIYL
jgi:hypothetical protein